MAQVLVMPRQGNTVESCLLASWRVAEGEAVRADQVVCDVETDKATFEVQAGMDGVLLKRLKADGEDVPVLQPIAVIGAAGEDWRAALEAGGEAGALTAPAAGAPPAPPAPVATDRSASVPALGDTDDAASVRISPRARGLANAAAVDTARLAGTGPVGRIIARDVQAAIDARPPLTAAARNALAAGASIPASGTALGGRVGMADLAAPPAGDPPAPAHEPTPAGAPAGFTEAPLKGVRKIIAERMRSSLASTAQLTLHGSAPAARLLALRARFKASDPARGLADVTLGDLVNYAVAQVVPRFPVLNSHLVNGALRTFETLNLGFAVDTPRGLLVPVLRDAGRRSLTQLSAEARRLAAACSGGAIQAEELTGATFTVTNLGALGVESFTPVLNAPEVAILGVGAIVPRPVLGPDGQMVGAEPRLGLSLTIDHQAVDGAPAARFLKALADAIGELDLLSWSR